MLKFLTKQKAQKDNLARPSRRFLAYSIDIFIVTFFRYLILVLFSWLWFSKSILLFKEEYISLANQGVYNLSSNKDFWSYFFSHNIFTESLFVLSIMAIAGALYWIIMPVTKYQGTIGKYVLKIHIVSEQNKQLTIGESVFRYFVALIPWGFHLIVVISIFSKSVGLLFFCMITVTFWYDPSIFRVSKRAVHDIICRTKVCNTKVQKQK